MITYNYPDPGQANYLNELSYTNNSNNPNYPKLIRIRAHTRWRLGKLEHVAAHWRYIDKHQVLVHMMAEALNMPRPDSG